MVFSKFPYFKRFLAAKDSSFNADAFAFVINAARPANPEAAFHIPLNAYLARHIILEANLRYSLLHQFRSNCKDLIRFLFFQDFLQDICSKAFLPEAAVVCCEDCFQTKLFNTLSVNQAITAAGANNHSGVSFLLKRSLCQHHQRCSPVPASYKDDIFSLKLECFSVRPHDPKKLSRLHFTNLFRPCPYSRYRYSKRAFVLVRNTNRF